MTRTSDQDKMPHGRMRLTASAVLSPFPPDLAGHNRTSTDIIRGVLTTLGAADPLSPSSSCDRLH